MVNCIQEETEFHFHLAHSAYITKTSISSKLGYLLDTEVSRQLIDGTYEIPMDVDDATALVMEEIARLGLKMRSSRGEEFVVSPEDF